MTNSRHRPERLEGLKHLGNTYICSTRRSTTLHVQSKLIKRSNGRAIIRVEIQKSIDSGTWLQTPQNHIPHLSQQK
ncbi:hypothetical protein HBI24_083140 [Parastagonospora nodorum]|nr:hypothetical protein HBH69_131700 [Parastagonospora nodorum]KAH5585954.1 hypothetical protein HBI24_083140 [Parastagonospora nodorum]KAH5654885.1 hypothetical protein HBI51_053910 [Parastagonospora nodorum]KAH5700022.1 hypothetical protein HBI44_057350 [Parastagonospora nodorum]KAH6119929.1 hypothetical protein HBI69_080550 [Parastagonospora nodorum]